MRAFVSYIVVFETNSSRPLPEALLPYPPPFGQSGNRAGPVRPDRPASSPGLDQKPTQPRLLRSLVKSLRTRLLDSVSDSLLSPTFNFSRMLFNRTPRKALDIDSSRRTPCLTKSHSFDLLRGQRVTKPARNSAGLTCYSCRRTITSGGLHATGVAKTDYWSGPHVKVVHYGTIASGDQLARQSKDLFRDCWFQLLHGLLLNGLV
jgi:hypothetical protein